MQKKKPNMFTVGSSTSATFVLPVRHGTCVAVQTKRMETDMLCGVMTKLKQVQKSANDLAIPTKQCFLHPASRHMCSSADKEDGKRHVMWSNDQAEAGAKVSKRLGNSR